MENIKIVALVPTRGDRPTLLANMHRMMGGQTMPLHGMVVVDDPPMDPARKDITYRYRTGIDRAFSEYPDCDLVAFIEDDDWYAPQYLERMIRAWIDAGKPHTFGLGDTHYYHIGIRKWHHQTHAERSSAFTTFVTRALLGMNWPADDYSFIDIGIWKQFPGKTVVFPDPLAIGIKGYAEGGHFAGIGHNAKWSAYNKRPDPNMEWLHNAMDEESFQFYKSILDNLI